MEESIIQFDLMELCSHRIRLRSLSYVSLCGGFVEINPYLTAQGTVVGRDQIIQVQFEIIMLFVYMK